MAPINHVPRPPSTITVSVTHARRPAPRRATIAPMNTSGIVLPIRWAKLACRNGEVRMPHKRPTLRGQMPSLSRPLESSVLTISRIHITATRPISSSKPARRDSRASGT